MSEEDANVLVFVSEESVIAAEVEGFKAESSNEAVDEVILGTDEAVSEAEEILVAGFNSGVIFEGLAEVVATNSELDFLEVAGELGVGEEVEVLVSNGVVA